MKIEFSQKAYKAMDEISDYIYDRSKSKKLTRKYVKNIRDFIIKMLSTFPKAGRVANEFGDGVRKLVYQHYSILYKIVDDKHIIVLYIYRENLPTI